MKTSNKGPAPKDWTGQHVGFARVLSFSHKGVGPKGKRFWNMMCDCGTEFVADIYSIQNGHKSSCGCRSRDWAKSGLANTKHGHRHATEYQSWAGMKQRCLNTSNPKFPEYGGRGICICTQWLNDFSAFLSDMGKKPDPSWTLDRIDNDGDYEPANCRWANKTTQANNRRLPRTSRTGRKLR